MRWLDHREQVPAPLRGAIVALGNFDGFHKGHQAVAGEAIRWAREEERPVIVATFDPHPVQFFRPDTPPFRLTSLEQRHELYLAFGATAMLVFHFDAGLAGTSAEDFIERILVERFGAHGVLTGEDFTFGKGAKGNAALLKEHGAKHGLEARTVSAVSDGDAVVSSSRIRDLLKAGEPQAAADLLTRPFAIRGIVEHGDKRGRTIGYPTANIDLGTYLRPRYGIYAVTGLLPGGRKLIGAANLGIRPTFDPPKELLEPYFFDFSGDLYNEEIEVGFHHFLRPEAKFDSLDALTAQMDRDCETARKLLGALL